MSAPRTRITPQPRPARPLLETLRTADWLTRDRVVAWSVILLIEELLIVGFLALWQHGVFTTVQNPPSSDFVSFYAAGKLALAGTPALAYDTAAHFLAQQHAGADGAGYQYFFYPPVFLLLCAALATLPYFLSYALFQVATLVPFVLVMRDVLRAPDWRFLPALLAFPAVFWTLAVGQNAFLTAALFGGFTLLIDRRPAAAGALLGMLCYKPHFGLLTPIALAAGRRWRAFGAALASVAALVGLFVLRFGWGTWQAYLHAFAGSSQVYESGAIDFAGIETPFGAGRLLGFPPGTAYALQLVSAMTMAGLTALIWHRRMSQPLRCASLLAATLLAAPLALLYDKLLLLLAIGWLLREAHATGFLPWEKLVLLLTWPASMVTWLIGIGLHVPLETVHPETDGAELNVGTIPPPGWSRCMPNMSPGMRRCPTACATVPLPRRSRPLSISTSTRSSQSCHRAATDAIEPEQKEDGLHEIHLTAKAPYKVRPDSKKGRPVRGGPCTWSFGVATLPAARPRHPNP